MNVLGKDCNTLGMDGAQVGVLKETNQVSLGRLLQSQYGGRLEAKIRLEVLSDFANQALERQLAEQKLSRLLVTTDLTNSDSARPVAMGLLHTTSSGGGLASSLGGESLAGRLATGGLTSGLLGTSHDRESNGPKRAALLFERPTESPVEPRNSGAQPSVQIVDAPENKRTI